MSASPPIRSFLFVPADSERKYQKASGTKADALILDLEDSVAQENLPTAREMAREYLSSHRNDRGRQQLWVRCNPLETPLALPDLAAIMAGAKARTTLATPFTFTAMSRSNCSAGTSHSGAQAFIKRGIGERGLFGGEGGGDLVLEGIERGACNLSLFGRHLTKLSHFERDLALFANGG